MLGGGGLFTERSSDDRDQASSPAYARLASSTAASGLILGNDVSRGDTPGTGVFGDDLISDDLFGSHGDDAATAEVVGVGERASDGGFAGSDLGGAGPEGALGGDLGSGGGITEGTVSGGAGAMAGGEGSATSGLDDADGGLPGGLTATGSDDGGLGAGLTGGVTGGVTGGLTGGGSPSDLGGVAGRAGRCARLRRVLAIRGRCGTRAHPRRGPG